MLDRRQLGDRLVSHALRGAVLRDQIGMRGLELPQPLMQAVVLEVRNLGLRLDVILTVVMADFFPQALDLGLDVPRHVPRPLACFDRRRAGETPAPRRRDRPGYGALQAWPHSGAW